MPEYWRNVRILEEYQNTGGVSDYWRNVRIVEECPNNGKTSD